MNNPYSNNNQESSSVPVTRSWINSRHLACRVGSSLMLKFSRNFSLSMLVSISSNIMKTILKKQSKSWRIFFQKSTKSSRYITGWDLDKYVSPNMWMRGLNLSINILSKFLLPFLQITIHKNFDNVLERLVALLYSRIHVFILFNSFEKMFILPHKIFRDAYCCWKLIEEEDPKLNGKELLLHWVCINFSMDIILIPYLLSGKQASEPIQKVILLTKVLPSVPSPCSS